MNGNIEKHISSIQQALDWADKFGKDAFPKEQLKDHRRKLNRIQHALEEKCSAAAYGESQVGKSYLMSSLLSAPNAPLVIQNGDKNYSFIDEINSSGGNTSKVESTGVITRFTIREVNNKMKDYVRVSNLTIVDIILMIADSYYNDVKISTSSVLKYDQINERVRALRREFLASDDVQTFITSDDVKDILDYFNDVIGNKASNLCQSDFCTTISPVISKICVDRWVDVFGILWNENEELNSLFSILVKEYNKIGFQSEVYIPFDAVIKDKGTLLNIEWLDAICGAETHLDPNFETTTNVYDKNGNLVFKNFKKGNFSALIAELTFVLPKEIAEERKFLNDIDLLDFPGARSREEYLEEDIKKVLPKMLRRGKVAYLFKKYSRSLRISSVLFCHHNDQKAQATIGSAINDWIENNVGKTAKDRASMIAETNGIAPLFFVATKFNMDLKRLKTDTAENRDNLHHHWKRFEQVFPEIIKPYKWLDEWLPAEPFKSIYPLRDFYWSSENRLFDGYDENTKTSESSVHVDAAYPEYMNDLRDSFLCHKFVQRHFADPSQAWEDFATVGNDGSKAIIRNLDVIAPKLDTARRQKYLSDLLALKQELLNTLRAYYEPEDIESNNKKARTIVGDIRMHLYSAVGENPTVFGKVVDSFMINSGAIRDIAYDVLICHTDAPKDFSQINFIRASLNIDPTAGREANIQKLCKEFSKTEEELSSHYKAKGFTLDEIVSATLEDLSTEAAVVTKHIIECWTDHMNQNVKELAKLIPHSEEIVFMLIAMLNKLGVKKEMVDRIDAYTQTFNNYELPNVVADYASITLNKFVASVGRDYMTQADLKSIEEKASACGIDIDTSAQSMNKETQPVPIMEALEAFETSPKQMKKDRIDMDTLRKLPLWDNFQRWENFLKMGLLYSSDISHADPVANAEMGRLIQECESLYNN